MIQKRVASSLEWRGWCEKRAEGKGERGAERRGGVERKGLQRQGQGKAGL